MLNGFINRVYGGVILNNNEEYIRSTLRHLDSSLSFRMTKSQFFLEKPNYIYVNYYLVMNIIIRMLNFKLFLNNIKP